MTFKLTGLPQLQQRLAALPDRVDRVTPASLIRAGGPLAERAEALAPRGPGGGKHLADSIVAVPVPGSDPPQVDVGPTTGVFYSSFVEWGTVKLAARPFFRPAWDQERPVIVASLGRDWWAALRGSV